VKRKTFVHAFLGLFILGTIFSCETIFWPQMEINVDDIPVYPNAQNITREGPETKIPEIYTWNFKTNDSPEVVWQYYVDEMSRRWGFYDTSSPQFDDKSLIVKSCPFYYLDMTSTSIDKTTYSITVKFGKQPCI
jgi:hypothetical protein